MNKKVSSESVVKDIRRWNLKIVKNLFNGLQKMMNPIDSWRGTLKGCLF